MRSSKQNLLLLLGLALTTFHSVRAGEPRMLWQIGKPDATFSDLAIAGNYSAFQEKFGRGPVVFEPGKSTAERDWPFIHPGPVDAWAGGRAHPFAIRFALSEPPRGVFTLRVAFVDAHYGFAPTMVVSVGDRRGELHLKTGAGDGSLSNPALGRPQRFELAMPAAFFKEGANELILSAAQGSWATYDSVELWNDPDVDTTNPEVTSLTVDPSPLIAREGGKLRRILKVNTKLSAPAAELALSVRAGGEEFTTALKALGSPDGYNHQITIPNSEETTELTLTVKAGNRSRTETIKIKPAKRWKIFVAPSAHTDIGYTDLQPKCVERHNENTDLALGLLEKYPEFKWNLEVAWQADNYLAAREGEKVEKFLRFAKDGRLGIQALYCNILTGLCSHESGARLTQYAYELSEKHGFPYKSAMISDVPTQEASLPMLLSGAGIRYFSSGINNDRAYPFNYMQNQSPCWWEGPDGSRVLMFYAWGYAQASGWGLDSSVEAAATRIVPQVQQYESRTNYPYDAIFLHGAFGDNSLLTGRLPEVVQAWNERYESPKVILSVNSEFFEYIDEHYGDKLPVFRGSAGTYWEDGAGSSAFETALCRNAKETLGTAEKMLALGAQLKPGSDFPAGELKDAWRNCALYDEHTWGAHCSISQPDSEFSKAQWNIKAQFAVDADRQAKSLLDQGRASLAALVRTDQRSLIIFNPASWPRTDMVRVQLPAGMDVVDGDVVRCDDEQGSLLLVKNVPACGYKVLKLVPKARQTSAQAEQGNIIESAFYRVTFDETTGEIRSVFDKKLRRELVDQKAAHGLNQYLYVAGGEGSRIVMNPNGPEPKLTISKATQATLKRYRLGNLGERMVIESSAPMAPKLVAEVTVWNDLRRVDFVNRLNKTQTYNKEAVYFAFPFAANDPVFRYQCPAGIVNANTDMLPGACLDWFTVQHCVEIDSGDAAIAWATPDAPLVCFQDINRGKWLRELPMSNGHLFSYAMNNYWHTNYKPGQGGDHQFRFSLTSRAKADNAASARFGWSASNPLLAIPAEPNPAGQLPPSDTSLVEIAEPNVLLIGAKKSESGNGLVLRLWEVNGKATSAKISLRHLNPRTAWACNLVEEPTEELPLRRSSVAVPVRAFGLATVRLEQ